MQLKIAVIPNRLRVHACNYIGYGDIGNYYSEVVKLCVIQWTKI